MVVNQSTPPVSWYVTATQQNGGITDNAPVRLIPQLNGE
jgi:hypothetical protein